MLGCVAGLFKPKTAFQREYELGKQVGKGAFSIVYLARQVSSPSEQVAVKVVLRKKMTKDDERALKVEVRVLEEVRGHAAIITLYKYFQEPKRHLLVLELMTGGELFQRIVKRSAYSEADAVLVVKSVAEVLEYIHARDIAHRDLKPENVLLKDDTDNAQVKIADFGFARNVGAGCKTACGTPAYVAPEVISGKIYSTPCDIWSLGVLMYVLLCGYPPFYARSRQDLFRQIRTGKVAFDDAYWKEISSEAKELIMSMLVVDTSKRYTAKQVLEHAWISFANSTDKIDAKRLMLFNAKRRLRAALRTAIAAGRIQDLVKEVKTNAHKD